MAALRGLHDPGVQRPQRGTAPGTAHARRDTPRPARHLPGRNPRPALRRLTGHSTTITRPLSARGAAIARNVQAVDPAWPLDLIHQHADAHALYSPHHPTLPS